MWQLEQMSFEADVGGLSIYSDYLRCANEIYFCETFWFYDLRLPQREKLA